MLKISGVILALLLTSPTQEDSMTADQEEEWRALARASRLVVEATVTDNFVPIVRPELRRQTVRRGPDGETLMHFKSPPDHFVGSLVRFRVDTVHKTDGRVAVGDVLEVVMPIYDGAAFYPNGTRWLCFLKAPFQLVGQDPESGWQTLERTTVSEAGTGREVPFVPHRAYGFVAGSMFSGIGGATRITTDNALLIDSVREQVALTVDTVVPTLTLTQPSVASGFQKGIASIAAAVSDDVGIREVQWLIERQPSEPPPPDVARNATVPLTAPTKSAPYEASWDSTQFADGPYVLWAMATDFAGNAALATTTIIIDNNAPSLTVEAKPSQMWPATGDLIPVRVGVVVSDVVDPAPAVRLVEIDADEPLTEGDVAGAQLGTDDREFALRATRTGTTRTYRIVFEATDQAGNALKSTTTVSVLPDAGPIPP